MKARCENLQRILHREVPLSETIGMGVHSYDGERLELKARLEPNVNIYGVAFGGSIYSMCALSGWGLLILKLEDEGLDPRIMIAGGEIKYLKPVDQAIRAVSSLPDAEEVSKRSLSALFRTKPCSIGFDPTPCWVSPVLLAITANILHFLSPSK